MHHTCPGCSKIFSSAGKFSTHINGRKNTSCKLAWEAQQCLEAADPNPAPPPPEQALDVDPSRGSVAGNDSDAGSIGIHQGHNAPDEGNYSINVDSPSPNPSEEDEVAMMDDDISDSLSADYGGGVIDMDTVGEVGGGNPPVPPAMEEAKIESDSEPEPSPEPSIREQFAKYSTYANHHYVPLPPPFVSGIELMTILDKAGAPKHLYDKIIEWHKSNLGTPDCASEAQLLKRLRERYNMEKTVPYVVHTQLPHWDITARVPCHDFEAMLCDLLTDPRIQESDYLWFNDDPLAPPPEQWLELRDINSGQAYRETYRQRIQPKPYTDSGRLKKLLPVPFYVDGCNTASKGFTSFSMEILKFTIGILNYSAREKDYLWRNLGGVPQYVATKSKAKAEIKYSGHESAEQYLSDDDNKVHSKKRRKLEGHSFNFTEYMDSEEENPDQDFDHGSPPTQEAAQDFHSILHTILHSYRKIQDEGIEWDLNYKGKVYQLQFLPFVIFVKADTVEADKHCGRYGSYNEGVGCLCRMCECRTEDADKAYGPPAQRKTPARIKRLIRKGSKERLEKISQKAVWNSWYEVQFGLHNDWGIHGATPVEILHWIHLGRYKYARDMFFSQCGPYSNLSKAINLLAESFGPLLKRQSAKLPRTQFSRTFQTGVIMAHEYVGLILVLATVVRSAKGRRTLLHQSRGSQSEFFQSNRHLDDWIHMLEMSLMMGHWLKQPSLRVNSVQRLKIKVKEVMELEKMAGKRTKGMGFKTMNFHSILHVPDDILAFGVPNNVNTQSNESHHRKDKQTAQRTQRRPGTFDLSILEKIEDRRVIEMGLEEVNGRPRWQYWAGFNHRNNKSMSKKAPTQPVLTGACAKFHYDTAKECYVYALKSRMLDKEAFKFKRHVQAHLNDIAFEVEQFLPRLNVYSEIRMTDGQIYRGTPTFLAKPWYDWAYCRLGAAVLPVNIQCFVDLSGLPDAQTTRYRKTTYALVETVRRSTDPDQTSMRSDLFQAYVKEESQTPGSLGYNKLTMVPIENIQGPAIVVPDLGNANKKAYFSILPMEKWAARFEEWINEPHTRKYNVPQHIQAAREGD